MIAHSGAIFASRENLLTKEEREDTEEVPECPSVRRVRSGFVLFRVLNRYLPPNDVDFHRHLLEE